MSPGKMLQVTGTFRGSPFGVGGETKREMAQFPHLGLIMLESSPLPAKTELRHTHFTLVQPVGTWAACSPKSRGAQWGMTFRG